MHTTVLLARATSSKHVSPLATVRSLGPFSTMTGPACWHQPAELDTHMPHEKPRPPARPSSPSFHTSSALGTKDVFHTKQLWVRAHAMADQSSQDRRARTGEDTQRVAYARAPLQVRRGGRTTTSMYCDTNVSKIVARSTSDNYIRCLLPQPFVPTCQMPCPCLCERSVCAYLPYLLCLNRFEFSDFCVQSARWTCTRL